MFKKHIGKFFMATGLLHILIGVMVFSAPLGDIMRDGIFFDAIGVEEYERATAFWFTLTGVFICITGGLAQWIYNNTNTLPAFLGYGVVVIGVIGGLMIPVSGFWLVIPQGIMMLMIARNAQPMEVSHA